MEFVKLLLVVFVFSKIFPMFCGILVKTSQNIKLLGMNMFLFGHPLICPLFGVFWVFFADYLVIFSVGCTTVILVILVYESVDFEAEGLHSYFKI